MRIVITSNYTIGDETGTAHVAEELSSTLSKNNIVTYVCVGNKYEIVKINSSLTYLKIPSLDIGGFPVPLITPKTAREVYKYLDHFKPDIVHAQNPFLISNLCQKWSRQNKVPFIVTFHHIPTEAVTHLVPKLSKNILAIAVQEIYKAVGLKAFLDKTDAVIALNDYVKTSIREVDKNIPIETISNGVDLKSLQKIEIKNAQKKEINFVSLGSYTERKNQKFLAKAFMHLPGNYKLRLFGNKKINGSYLSELIKLINQNKIGNVFIEDYETDLVKVFEKADFFVTASVKEVQSLAIIQAMAAGRPVIGLSNETVSELINKDNGLSLPLDISPDKFSKSIINFVEKCNYKKLAKQIRLDSTKFEAENVVKRIEEYYARCIIHNT